MGILRWIVIACVVFAVIGWIGKAGHGAMLGRSAGNAVHGAYEGVSTFIDKATG